MNIVKTIDLTGESAIPEEILSGINGKEAVVALTGAGISVESGIPDFRSPGGLWERFDPSIYAALDTFLTDPALSWELFREVERTLEGRKPNPAHISLANMERRGLLKAVITQNIDSLHRKAGSRCVIEVHGDHRNLECLKCGAECPLDSGMKERILSGPAAKSHGFEVPLCNNCRFPLKPSVVLFGEAVRHVDRAEEALLNCEVLFVVGTSAEVYPVASFPFKVRERGGMILEFNLKETPLTNTVTDYFIRGKASKSLPLFEEVWNKASDLSET